MMPLSAYYGPVLFYGAMTLHGVLVLALAVAWIRFTQREAAQTGPAFQFSLADTYAAVVSLLPWLWLVSVTLRIKPDSDAPPSDIAGMVWGLCLLLFFLVCGWLLAVLHRRIIDRGNRAPDAALTLCVSGWSQGAKLCQRIDGTANEAPKARKIIARGNAPGDDRIMN